MMKHPPFCPNKHCDNYSFPEGNWYVKYGTYQSQRSGKVQRFKCRSCGTTFTIEIFNLNYYTHIVVPYKSIFEHLNTSSGIRDMSRILKIACSTVINRISRLARQSMAVSAELTRNLELNEDLVADGFESFVKSQYLPNNINILAGKDSQFWFLADYAQMTRKGRMTENQKKKNELIKKRVNINRVTIYESFQNIVNEAYRMTLSSGKDSISLFTDKHPQYRKVMELLSFKERLGLRHIRISSKQARTVTNPLFSVNYLDRELRKDTADHTRETVQFARNVGNMLDRLAVYRLYHNYLKPYRINGGEYSGETHGSMAGISKKLIEKELKTLFTRRRFLGKHGFMNDSDRKLWCKCIFTPLNRRADVLPGYVLA